MARSRTKHGGRCGRGGVGDLIVFLSLMAFATCLVAGVFYAFSDFVMRSLGAIPMTQGAAAMVSINRVILRASFVPMLLVLGPLALGSVAWTIWVGSAVGANWVFAASGIYVVGVLGVTMLGNVPLNNRLDQADNPVSLWPMYMTRWTRLNTLRTAASAVASLCYLQAVLAIVAHPIT